MLYQSLYKDYSVFINIVHISLLNWFAMRFQGRFIQQMRCRLDEYTNLCQVGTRNNCDLYVKVRWETEIEEHKSSWEPNMSWKDSTETRQVYVIFAQLFWDINIVSKSRHNNTDLESEIYTVSFCFGWCVYEVNHDCITSPFSSRLVVVISRQIPL